MHGNRDFMIGAEFMDLIGAELLDPISTIKHPGLDLLLCHGDHLCTDDIEHQEFRDLVLDPKWQQRMLQQPIESRFEFATKVRQQSAASKIRKDESIMDVNQEAVRNIFSQYQANIVIHGHTHRPAMHEYKFGADECLRIVLGDWGHSASYLEIEDERMRLVSGSDRTNYDANFSDSSWQVTPVL